jgi:hypothetical protein
MQPGLLHCMAAAAAAAVTTAVDHPKALNGSSPNYVWQIV